MIELTARRCLKIPVLLTNLLPRKREPGFSFLIYHRVSGQSSLELDLPYPLFRRQMELLAQTGRVISYDEALNRLQSGQPNQEEAFILTFDDGYRDFYARVFPLLRELHLPVILFVTTGFVESGLPYPILSRRIEAEPVSWEMLAEMVESGLVTVGAHTHTHPKLLHENKEHIIRELADPLALFRERLGLEVRHFAYPRGDWNSDLEELVGRYYRSAVIGGGQKASPGRFHPYRIPRIPIRRSDGWLFFRAKIEGRLNGEEALYQRLHAWQNSR